MVLARIIAYLYRQNPERKILVTTLMEATADLLAKALFEIPEIKEKVCRMYSKFNNEILSFNFDFYVLPEWCIHHKLLKKQYEKDLDRVV